MADEEIRIDLRAEDHASDKLDDVADLVEGLEKKKPTVKVDADTRAAAADLKDLTDDAKALDKLTPTVDVAADTGTADADLKATRDLAEAVAKADATILVKAQIDDAKANLKELRGELDRLTGAGSSGGPVAGATVDVDHYTESTGKAKDATHSFVGNAITELPGVGTAFGPASEAISQLTEGVLAGEIAMKGLALAAGAIAGVGIAVTLITSELGKIEKTDAFHRDRVDDWTDAIRDAQSALAALRTKLADDEKVTFISDGDERDAVDSLARLGLKIGDFTNLVSGGKGAIAEWSADLAAAKPKVKDFIDVLTERKLSPIEIAVQGLESADADVRAWSETMLAATQASTDLGDATTGADERAAVFGRTAVTVAGQTRDMSTDTHAAQLRMGELKDEARDAKPKIDDLREAYKQLTDKLSDRSAYLDVEDAFAALDAAAVTAFTAVQTNAGDADQAVRDHERAVIAVKDAVIKYAEQVEGLPPEKVSKILAQIDDGAFATVEEALAALEKDRNVNVITHVVGSSNAPRVDYSPPLPARGESTVNVYMPAGSSGTDVLRVIDGSIRRSGDLFGG